MRNRYAVTAFGGLQWLVFMFANTVVIPLSVGAAFHLPPAAIAAGVQRSFILTGAACLLQLLVGHRWSLMEGQSGLWWGVILSLIASAAAMGESLAGLGGSLSIGIALAGLTSMLIGAFGAGRILQRFFTPVVMFVFLLMLACQLSGIFLKGMLGIAGDGPIRPDAALLSFAVSALVAVLLIAGKGLISQFALLIGFCAGWAADRLLLAQPQAADAAGSAGAAGLLQAFAWGAPAFDWKIVLLAVLTGLLNTTNTVATLNSAEEIYERPVAAGQMNRSFLVTGLVTALSGVFAIVPYAPYASSIGFLRSTRIRAAAPFAFGAILFLVIGLVPALGRWFSAMPVAVGDAVLLIAYLQLFGSALKQIEGLRFTVKTIYRLALPSLIGISILAIPPAAFATLPAAIRPLIGSGMLVGISLSVVMENAIPWHRWERQEDEQA